MTPPTIPVSEDRRESGRQTCEKLELMEERLLTGDERMTRIEHAIAAHREDTAEVLEILKMGKSFFKVVGAIGNGVKWIGSTVAAFAALWYLFKGK